MQPAAGTEGRPGPEVWAVSGRPGAEGRGACSACCLPSASFPSSFCFARPHQPATSPWSDGAGEEAHIPCPRCPAPCPLSLLSALPPVSLSLPPRFPCALTSHASLHPAWRCSVARACARGIRVHLLFQPAPCKTKRHPGLLSPPALNEQLCLCAQHQYMHTHTHIYI